MSVQAKAILDLGKKLVDELGIDDNGDTLSRWMAHYIAELIHDAENAAPEDKQSKEQQCSAAILDLWRRRAELPDGKRPFEDVEPILRALASLDPSDETPRYFRPPRMMADAKPDTEADKWLKTADGIDSTAKELIRHCLARAAQTAEDRTEEWVALAEKAGLDNDSDVRVLRILIKVIDISDEEEVEDAAREQLEKRIERLGAFQAMATELAADLQMRLRAED